MSKIDTNKYFKVERNEFGFICCIQEVGDTSKLIKDIHKQNDEVDKLKNIIDEIENLLKEICNEECDFKWCRGRNHCGDDDCRYMQIMEKVKQAKRSNK